VKVLEVMQQQGIVREFLGDATALATILAALEEPTEAG
jgi:hypothetical protein